jgi:glyoxylase-like metal-dependent hydrolase (beta-lactamase superfamily II)
MKFTEFSRAAHGLAVLFVGAACASSPGLPAPDTSTHQRAPLTIHRVAASPNGILVNAYLVEGGSGVVAVDSALTVSDARALRLQLDALGKPLLAVIVTHGHPDHYNGVSALVEGRANVPVYATGPVARVIRDSDAAKEAQWRPMFGAEWPAQRTFPNHELRDGEAFTLDALRFRVESLGPGESHADSVWTVQAEGSDEQHAFLGDVVMHGVHAYVSDGHTTEWLRNIQRLRRELEAVSTLYPGHGTPGRSELFDWQQRYLETYRAEVAALLKGSAGQALDEEQKRALTATMKAHYPDAPLEFLIPLGADAVARELAKP